MNESFAIRSAFGGYSLLGGPEPESAEDLPAPPARSDPLEGVVEVVEGGAFVWAIRDDWQDDYLDFQYVGDEFSPATGQLARNIITRFQFRATEPVAVNTFDWEFVTTLDLPRGLLSFELLMMPRGADGRSREIHQLRLASAS